jgi:hypothetical protein
MRYLPLKREVFIYMPLDRSFSWYSKEKLVPHSRFGLAYADFVIGASILLLERKRRVKARELCKLCLIPSIERPARETEDAR